MRDPSACRHCGVSRREHLNRWASEVGHHQWTQPTWEQRRTAILHNARAARADREYRQMKRALNVPFVWDPTDTRGDAAMDAWRKTREESR